MIKTSPPVSTKNPKGLPTKSNNYRVKQAHSFYLVCWYGAGLLGELNANGPAPFLDLLEVHCFAKCPLTP